jgi:hypothetical protein
MIIFLALLIVYVLTVILWWIYAFFQLNELKKEITIGDILKYDMILYTPIVSTIVLGLFLIGDLFYHFKEKWHKFLNIKIKKKKEEC